MMMKVFAQPRNQGGGTGGGRAFDRAFNATTQALRASASTRGRAPAGGRTRQIGRGVELVSPR